ncbi:MAG: lipoyl synthase [Syntrophales bacterium]
MRKPDWLKVRIPSSAEFKRVKGAVERHGLHTVCREARCPNIAECFHSGTATFLILGDTCTRNCLYCNIKHGTPARVDESEPERLARAAAELGLHYVVITSVARDDLPDGGAGIFARAIECLRREVPGCGVEVLIPDLRGDWKALEHIIRARPDVINHNMEVVKPLFKFLRPEGDFGISLDLLRHVHDRGIVSKSGFMIGFGESREDILELIGALAQVNCQRLTIGQYQQPTAGNPHVSRYYSPADFDDFKEIARRMGFASVESGPLVRSSYRAAGAG